MRVKNAQVYLCTSWCREGDSNPHTLRRRILNPIWLSRQIIMMREHAAHYLMKTGRGCMRVCGLRVAE